MKVLILTVLLGLFSSGVWAQENTGKPFAVVELFASEGCSSCPPAYDLLDGLTRQAKENGSRVFTLTFEVDYWNYLGWNDPFSSSSFSQRQQQYASVLPGGVYTPEMIINGKQAFVGSDSNSAQKYIQQYLQTPGSNNISIKIKDQDTNKINLTYTCDHFSKDSVINVALVRSNAESHVTAGENDGRDLTHINIVQEFTTIPLDQLQGDISLSASLKPREHYSIVAYLQNEQTREILGADSLSLN